MLLIGSHALNLRGGFVRKPLDYDLIGSYDELSALTRALRFDAGGMNLTSIPLSPNKTVLKRSDGLIVEFEIAWSGTAAAELEGTVWAPCDRDDPLLRLNGRGFDIRVPTLDELYTLKLSHRYLKNSPHFLKTRDDIVLMRKLGAKVHSEAWLRKRELETYTYNHPKLNVMKKDFFTGDGVQYVYDHDTIHVSMAHLKYTKRWTWNPEGPAVPAYVLYAKEGEEVKSDRTRFFDAPTDVRLYGVLEEAQVLALERSQIPFRGKVEPRKSFDIALRKVCTSITSGWFREYAWENFDRVNELYEPNYVDRFWRAVDAGIVRKIAATDGQDATDNPSQVP